MNQTYIFSQPAKDVINHLQKYWAQEIIGGNMSNPLFQRWLRSYYLYYGFQFQNYSLEAGLVTIGDQSELVGYAPNQFRNFIKTTFGLLTQNRVAFDVNAISDDITDINIASISNYILENYYYSKNEEKDVRNSVEVGMIFGTVFGGWFWNEMNKIIGVDADGSFIWDGELKFEYFTPLDIRIETFIDQDKDLKWGCLRKKVNRHELIGQYPHLEEEILCVPPIPRGDLGTTATAEQDIIWMKEFYHVSSVAGGLWKGRFIKYVGTDVVLRDTENPYVDQDFMGSGLPFVRFRPDVIPGNSYGHTVAFDLIPSQEYLGIIHSSIATAVSNMGIPTVVMPSANSIDDVQQISNGMRVIYYRPVEGAKDGGIPQTLNLLQLSPDLIRERELVIRDMEQVSAINSALRGNPAPGVQAASAIALLTTQAQTYNSSLEKNYIIYNEEVAKKLIQCCSIFMKNKEIVSIVGTSQKYSAEEFTAGALRRIKDIKVTIGNFLGKSTAGRLTMASELLNAQAINVTEYLNIINTGQTSPLIKGKSSEETLITWENEQLLNGQKLYVEMTENHLMHILGHTETLKIPQVKSNVELSKELRDHIADHMDNYIKLSTDNPQLLALITGSPIPPIPSQPGMIDDGGEVQLQVDGEQPMDVGGNSEPPATEAAAQASGDPEALAGRAMRRAMTEVQKVQ